MESRANCSDSHDSLRATVFLENGVAGDHALESTRVSTVDDRNERINIHIAERGIERKIRVKTGH
jgi:hypothetical protein